VEVIDFKVTYLDPGEQYRKEDRARVFAWNADTPLLVVEVPALAEASPDAWQATNIRDVVPRAGSDATFKAARAKHYQVVYLAAGAGSPMVARKMRDWVETWAQGERRLPDGPVLGPWPDAGDAPTAATWSEVLASLRRRFRGPFAGVAKDPRVAEVIRDAGATAFMVGAPDAPQGVNRIPSWTDLAARLPK
jgi:hypothetical protein